MWATFLKRFSKYIPLLSAMLGVASFGADIANDALTEQKMQEYISKEVEKKVAQALRDRR